MWRAHHQYVQNAYVIISWGKRGVRVAGTIIEGGSIGRRMGEKMSEWCKNCKCWTRSERTRTVKVEKCPQCGTEMLYRKKKGGMDPGRTIRRDGGDKMNWELIWFVLIYTLVYVQTERILLALR